MTHIHPTMLAILPGFPGWAEMLVIAFVALLIFGKRLPDVARSLGQSIVEFKKGMGGIKSEIETAAKTPTIPNSNSSQALPPSNAAPTDTESAPTAQPDKQSVESAD